MSTPKENIVLEGELVLKHPNNIHNWLDDMKQWPSITYGDIYNYLIESKSVDGKEMKSYKGLDSFNYFQSGWVVSFKHSYSVNT
jgi:hypothetical protein